MLFFALPDLVWQDVLREWLTLAEVCRLDTALSTKMGYRAALNLFYTSPFFQFVLNRDFTEHCSEMDHMIINFLDWLNLRNCRVMELGVTIDGYDLSEAKLYPFVTRCVFTSFTHQLGVESHMAEIFTAFPNLTEISFSLNITLGLVRKLALAPRSYILNSIRFLYSFEDNYGESEITQSILLLLDRFKDSIVYFESIDSWNPPIMQFIYSFCSKITYMHKYVSDAVSGTVYMDCLHVAAPRIEEINLGVQLVDLHIVSIAPELVALRRVDLSGLKESPVNISYRSVVALLTHCPNLEFLQCRDVKLAKWQHRPTAVVGFDLDILSNECLLSSPTDLQLLLSVMPPIHNLKLLFCDEDIVSGLCAATETSSVSNIRSLFISGPAVLFSIELMSLFATCKYLDLLYVDDTKFHHTKGFTAEKWNSLLASIGNLAGNVSDLYLIGLKRLQTKDLLCMIADMSVLRMLKLDYMSLDLKQIGKFIRKHKPSCRLCTNGDVPSHLMIHGDCTWHTTFLYPD